MMLSGYDAVGRQSPPIVAFHDADSRSVLHLAFVAAPYGVVVSGEDGTILFVNGAASEIFAYSPDELIGQPFSRLLAEPAPESHNEQWQEFWKSPVSRTMIPDCTIAGIRRGGVRVPLAISLNALADGPTHYVIASMVDITERLDLEARLAAATNAHLGFQRLIADVAVRLGAVDPDSVDDVVVDCLRQIGEVLQFDGVALWRWKAGDAVAIPTHHWVQASCPSPHDAVPLAPIPFVIARLKEGEGSCFATVDELPDPAVREMFRRHGLRSGAVIPLEPAGDSRRRAPRPVGRLHDARAAVAPGDHSTTATGRRRDEPGLRAPDEPHVVAEGARRDSSLARSPGVGKRGAPPGGEGPEALPLDCLGKRCPPAGDRAGRTGRAHTLDRPAARRNRNRQGGHGTGHPRHEPASSAAR